MYSRIMSFAARPVNRPRRYRAAAVGMCPLGGSRALAKAEGKPLYFLPVFPDHPARHQVLQFFIGTQTQHFFAAARRISRPEVFMEDLEELFKLERSPSGKDRNQLFGNEIRHSA